MDQSITLTDYQYKQLLHIKLEGDFQYKNDDGNRVSRQAWVKMIDSLTSGGLIVIKNGPHLTGKGERILAEYLNK